MDLGRGGSVDAVAVAVAWWGAPYTDFTMVTDIKLNAIGGHAGFAIGFRGQPRPAGDVLADDQSDLQSAYLLLASTHDLRMTLLRLVDNKTDVLVPWTQVRSMRTSNGTNHVVIRSAGSLHIVNINGEEIVKIADERLHGRPVVLGALSYGEPIRVVFDNLLVTTPR